MTVDERIDALRKRMKESGVQAYLIPSDDFHGSEYVCEHFKCREYITGFDGSAGTALVTLDEALLWTDGRYFIQAAQQLEGTEVRLMKMDEPGVPRIEEYLYEHIRKGELLSFDGRCMKAEKGTAIQSLMEKKGASVKTDLDLVGEIWPDRPPMPCSRVWELPLSYTGKSRSDKIRDMKEKMKKLNCSYYVISSLDDIAWLLNLRGDDVACNPVFLSYAVLTENELLLFARKSAFEGDGKDPFHNAEADSNQNNESLDKEPFHNAETDDNPDNKKPDMRPADESSGCLIERLEKDHVRLLPYDEILTYLSSIPEESRILIDKSSVNYAIWNSLPSKSYKIKQTGPVMLAKAVKTQAEMDNMRLAHIRDGVAVTRFIYWLKKRLADPSWDEKPETELSVAEKLEEFRKMQPHYMGPSFETIASWGYHGAIVHYSASPETNIPLEKHSFLLVDSGGQYLEGTTDITRTIALGELSDEEKKYFTLVLKGHLNLADCRFKYGCSGTAFDYIARKPLWDIGMDYNHGTGHGVGYCLNVHEAPNSFSYKSMQGRRPPAVFEEGMVTSDEPGFYLEGKFGIRHENLLLCLNDYENEYGRFMKFEYLTMVPFDLQAVVPELMTENEKELLNEYHRMVYKKISPFLEGDEKEWLKEACREIH